MALPELIITWDYIFMATTEGSTIILYHLLENGYRPRIAGFLVEISKKTLFIAWYSYFRLFYMCPQLVIWLFQVLGRFQPEFREETVIFRHFSIFSIHHLKIFNKFCPAYLDLFQCSNLFLLDMLDIKMSILLG